MGALLVVAVLLLGGAVAFGPVVWSWLDPASPARVAERLLAVLTTWNAVRDFEAEVAIQSAEGETVARVLFLAPANLRVDVLSPQRLAGTMFALRPADQEWLLVHYRPGMDLGIDTRLPAQQMDELLGLPSPAELPEGLRQGRVRVIYTAAVPADAAEGAMTDQFDVSGLSGRFPRIVLRVAPDTRLPREVDFYADPTSLPALRVHVRRLTVNLGLELRDVFLLDVIPQRWLVPPSAPPED